MNYYKATIQYDGTSYFGFQWQKDIPTIQNDFNLSLQRIVNGKFTTMGASRTDTGVHAFRQIVKISSEHPIDCELALNRLKDILPLQIRCLGLEPCDGLFRPWSQSISKEYRYLFTNNLRSNNNDQKYIANNPYLLDINRMKQCAQLIVGQNNFCNFRSMGSNVTSTIRHVLSCELSEIDPHAVLTRGNLFVLPEDLRKCYQLRIVGKGFLKQMVRHLVISMWLVGSGKLSLDEFQSLLCGPEKERRLWKVAPAKGLYLYELKTL